VKEALMPEDKNPGVQNESPEDRFERDIEELEAPTWRTNKTQLVALIVLLIAAAAFVTFLATRERAKTGKAAVPSIMAMELIEPRPGKLSNTPTKFRWETISGTKYYAFSLTPKNASSVLIQRAPSNPTITLTPEELGRLEKGASYAWGVEAYSDTGKLLAKGQAAFEM
jgi:hypothetical protein